MKRYRITLTHPDKPSRSEERDGLEGMRRELQAELDFTPSHVADEAALAPFRAQAAAMGEDGGTLGPLPDGYTVTVTVVGELDEATIAPVPRSASARRELRRQIRNGLGAHSSEAPDTLAVLRAARDLSSLVRLATGNRFELVLIDPAAGVEVGVGDAIRMAVESRGGGR